MTYRALRCFYPIVILFFGCNGGTRNLNNIDIQHTKKPTSLVEVKTFTIKLKPFSYQIQSTGKIKAFKEQVVVSEASGIVQFCMARNGANVSINESIVTLDSKALQLRIAKVKENIFNSRLNYQSDMLSQESLLKEKNKGVKDTIDRKLKISSGLSTNELELKELSLELLKTNIKAPFLGKLANVKVQNGMRIKSGDQLFTIFTSDDLFLEASILESDIDFIKIGDVAKVVSVSGEMEHKAIVSEINPIVGENGLIYVKLHILDTSGLLPGMNASARIQVPKQESLIAPKEAIVMRSGKPVVFIMENNKAKWIYVTLGRDNGKEVEIKDGLKEGQKLIISNNLQLGHDAPVKEEKL